MLRDCIKFEPLAKIVLNDMELFCKFFDYVQLQQFDIAADAFSTFKDLLTNHKILCATFLETNYEPIIEKYVKLLHSGSSDGTCVRACVFACMCVCLCEKK